MKYLINTALFTVILFASLSSSEIRAEDSNSPHSFFIVSPAPQVIMITSNLQLILKDQAHSSMEISHENEMMFENLLEIESWMLEVDWSEGQDMFLESELQLEGWMENFKWMDIQDNFREKGLSMEKWMKNPGSWIEPSM